MLNHPSRRFGGRGRRQGWAWSGVAKMRGWCRGPAGSLAALARGPGCWAAQQWHPGLARRRVRPQGVGAPGQGEEGWLLGCQESCWMSWGAWAVAAECQGCAWGPAALCLGRRWGLLQLPACSSAAGQSHTRAADQKQSSLLPCPFHLLFSSLVSHCRPLSTCAQAAVGLVVTPPTLPLPVGSRGTAAGPQCSKQTFGSLHLHARPCAGILHSSTTRRAVWLFETRPRTRANNVTRTHALTCVVLRE
jgi:hypothetical protein